MEKRTADVVQTILAVVGVTAGLIPLVRVLLGGGTGIWISWIPGTDADPGRWVVPAVVIVVAVVVVAGVERAKRP